MVIEPKCAHYADYFTMPSLYPEFLISSVIQPKYLGISPDLLGIVKSPSTNLKGENNEPQSSK
jgi:hypothetical protein